MWRSGATCVPTYYCFSEVALYKSHSAFWSSTKQTSLSLYMMKCNRYLTPFTENTPLIHCFFKLFLLSTMTHSMSKYFALVHPRVLSASVAQALMFCVVFGRPLFILFSAFLPLYCCGRGRRGHDPMIVEYPITYAISAYNHWCLWVRSNLDQGNVYNIMWQCLSVTSNRSVVFSGYSIKLTVTL